MKSGLVASEVAVGLDVGTTGVKAIAVAADGSVRAVAERGYPLATPRPGWSEQDPEDWWSAARATLTDLGDLEIAGIGLSGQMHGLVALDTADRVVRPAILWNDQRTGVECAEIEERVGFDRLVELTGNRKLLAMYRRLVNELHLFRRTSLAQGGALPVSTREHRDIVDRIAAGQAAAAGRALYDHVVASRTRMHKIYGETRDLTAAAPRRTAKGR